MTPPYQRFRVGGVVQIDLRIEHDESDTLDAWRLVGRAIESAAYAPAGAHVQFLIGSRQHVHTYALAELRESGRHLASVDFVCDDPDTIRQWCAALTEAEAA